MTSTSTDAHRSPDEPTARSSTRSPTRLRALSGTGAVLAALAVWAVADPLAGVDLRVAADGEVMSIGAGMVAAAAAVAAGAGWALLEVLERVTARARPVWLSLALAVFAVSMPGPLDGVTTGAVVSLAAMHVAVAAVLIPGLAAASRRTRVA